MKVYVIDKVTGKAKDEYDAVSYNENSIVYKVGDSTAQVEIDPKKEYVSDNYSK